MEKKVIIKHDRENRRKVAYIINDESEFINIIVLSIREKMNNLNHVEACALLERVTTGHPGFITGNQTVCWLRDHGVVFESYDVENVPAKIESLDEVFKPVEGQS